MQELQDELAVQQPSVSSIRLMVSHSLPPGAYLANLGCFFALLGFSRGPTRFVSK